MTSGQALNARGFGPGLPPEGAAVRLHVSGDRLRIEGWPGVTAPGRDPVHARRQGTTLLLEWDTPAGPCALAVDAQEAARCQTLQGWVPASTHRHDSATRNWLWMVLFIVIGLPVLLAAGFFMFRAPLMDAVVERIPVEQERAVADELWKLQRPQLRLLEGTAANRFIDGIGARLVAAGPSGYTYRFHVSDDPVANAFAMPGGYIVIHRGLIAQAESAEELAGVLAHEIEHVERRHALRGLVQAAGLAVVWAAVTGDLGGGMAGQWLRDLAGLHFTREQEIDADTGGVARLLAAGIDPRGLEAFFTRTAAAAPAGGRIPDLLSTHPSGAERATRLRQLLREAPRFTPLEQDWPRVRASM